MQTLLAKTGIFSPERSALLDELAATQRDKDRLLLATKLRREANLFPRYAAATLGDVGFVERTAPDALPAYLDVASSLRELLQFPRTVILRGDNGPGKTHLASALVNSFCDNGRSAFYCTALDFYRQLKSTFGSPGKTAEDLIRRFRRYDLLVIDEIEVRSESKWENDELRSLVDARYASLKATVIITNKRVDEIQTYFSQAIIDRVRENGGIIPCDWQSLRGANCER